MEKEERLVRRSAALLLVSCLMLLGLTACGGDDKQPQDGDQDAVLSGDTAGDNTSGQHNAANGGGSPSQDADQGGSLAEDAREDLEDVKEDVGDAARDVKDAAEDAAERARLARPDDKDGDLTDQENGFARNSLR